MSSSSHYEYRTEMALKCPPVVSPLFFFFVCESTYPPRLSGYTESSQPASKLQGGLVMYVGRCDPSKAELRRLHPDSPPPLFHTGPKQETVNDFWKMVWEQKSATIVMLTNLKERKEEKCYQYWPDQGCWTYGNIRVCVEDCVVLVDYTIRKFCIHPVHMNVSCWLLWS